MTRRSGVSEDDGRILVAYATCFGSTAEVATALGDSLAGAGRGVDVRPIGEDLAVDGYRAVLVGSAVHHAKWLPEAVDFVRRNRAALGRVPVAAFCVHIQNVTDDEKSRRNRLAYLDGVREIITPEEEGFFAGRFDRRGARLLLPRWVTWLVPPIDLRSWKKIHAWAEHVRPRLA